MIARVLDVSRHRFILRSFLGEFWSWHTGAPVGLFPLLVAYAGVGCVLRGARLRQLIAAAPLVVVVFSYYGVYLVTPLDLKWQIATSLARILVHVVPAFVYLCFAFPTDAGRHAAPVPVGLPMELQRGDGQFSAGPRI